MTETEWLKALEKRHGTELQQKFSASFVAVCGLGGLGSISGSIIASFLYILSSEWLLHGLDSGVFLGISAPGIFKNGFRMAVFSVIIMVIVLFFRKGIMGDKELPDLIDPKYRRKKRKEAAGK